MPAKGCFLYHLDKTTCGGSIVSGASNETYDIGGIRRQQARVGDPVTCGVHEGLFRICGGMGDTYTVNGAPKEWAGSIESFSSCPCRARFAPSVSTHTYDYNCNAGLAASREQDVRKKKLIEAKAKGLEPMPLPALIYQTKRQMDDYQAKDMHHGDLDILALRNTFRLNVDDVPMKVNPMTLKLKEPEDPFAFASPYVHPDFQPKPMPTVSREQAAALMFDEFRELAKLFSFQGPYKNIITEMIDHMQENSGTPYSSLLLDSALKEQILNDQSEKSTLLKIKDILGKKIDTEYGFYPLNDKSELFNGIAEQTILPKFNRLIDRTNGLVISVHDTWATHITLESLEVTGNSYWAKVHYRIQDHFGLDDTDVQNELFWKFRIFRLWFVLQRWDQYGYKPFITEMNATVDISGILDE
ncbi:DUF3289 family protein [Buttiauxella sp. 3AFRM03]|uniref:PAAR domain-containing protein n=1 Tax=Buttiauxella sp. 3AFRM03 TaxID=2479367 RepID=UPI000EF83ECC|nr:PAAR domain-containing protein [Buttiauxella sp. 3AFRM03]AYN29014.1 DUF3289 family protein [Buttiauxella sp. 3AFRM03]